MEPLNPEPVVVVNGSKKNASLSLSEDTDHGVTSNGENGKQTQSNFRKRRLSLPRHNLESETDDDTFPVVKQQQRLQQTDTSSMGTPEHQQRQSDDETTDGKAHTFRKRRLSLSCSTEDEDETAATAKKQQRRLSVAESVASSATGVIAEEAAPSIAKPRILHSVEMIAGPFAPPSPIHHHVLHRQNPLPPSQISALDDDLLLTQHHTFGFSSDDFQAIPGSTLTSPARRSQKKKRRNSWRQRHHHVDEDKLPFPKLIVGTYSCHGIEPIYDSDYENEQPSPTGAVPDDDDFSWGSSEEKRHTTANAGGDPPHPSPPQPQTAARAISAKINQDRGGITFPYANSDRTALFAVYDGHGQGGELVSQFALHEIQRRLKKHPLFLTDLEMAMRETFLAVDEALKHEPIIEPYFAGTTACVALLQHHKLTLANAGDSRAVLARRFVPDQSGRWSAIDLTKDQNPDSPLEMERILKAGGYVSPPPGPGLSARVWLDSEMTQIGLAMGRSIGDHAVSNVGVIADPVVTTFDVKPGDDFMILASDGVWEFLSSQEAVQIVGKHLTALGATKACQALIEAAASKWHDEEGEYRDDITAIVVNLPNLWGEGGSNITTNDK